MVNVIVMGLGVLWLGYKWVGKREMRYILAGIVLSMTQLSRWPFFLNPSLVFGLLGIISAVMLSIEFYIKKQFELAYPYILVFFSIGVWLLSRVLLECV